MNTYVFYVTYTDGGCDAFKIVAPTRTMAREMLIKEWDLDMEEVDCIEEDNEEEDDNE